MQSFDSIIKKRGYMENKENYKLNITPADFDRIYEQNLSKYPTYKAAYHATEKIHEEITGHRKYSDSESYRTARNRRIKKR